MKGDFSRLTFDPKKHFSSVRMQQGRVQLDADWNEQLDVTMHRLETEITDFVGPSGVPADAEDQSISFEIAVTEAGDMLTIGPGRCYLAGKLFENETQLGFTEQPDYPGATLPEAAGRYLVYLDAWPRHITSLEDPGIRESALGGPDTATRIKNVWQVRVCEVGADIESADLISAAKLGDFFAQKFAETKEETFLPISTGALQARMNSVGVTLENQLYRVEVHTSGSPQQATFKWSRDNGSVAARVAMVAGRVITIDTSGGMPHLSFAPGQWVELSTPAQTLQGEPGLMARLQSVQGNELTVVSWPDGGDTPPATNFEIVRRWDSPDGPPPLAAGADGWILLEDEIEVKFAADGDLFYKSGDYWLIPARHLTGDIDWPRDETGPLSQPPQGIQHYTTALALLDRDKQGKWAVSANGDLRTRFKPITVGLLSKAGDVVEGSLRIVQDLQVDGVMSGVPDRAEGLVVEGDLTIRGNLNVSGKSAELVEQQMSGDVVLGDSDQSKVTIYGVLGTRHSSKQLEVGAPLHLNAPLTVSGITIGDSAAAAAVNIQSDQQLPLRVSSANPAGTGLTLENTSKDGRAWELVSTGASSTEGAGHLLFSPGNLLITRSGDVGIGTTTPGSILHIKSSTNNDGLVIQSGNNANNQGIAFRNSGNANTWHLYRQQTTINGNGNYANLVFGAGLDTDLTKLDPVATFTPTGNVGIGTTGLPEAKLDVNGNIRFGGQLQTAGIAQITPIYIRGTGQNNNSNRKLVIGGAVVYNEGGRGLSLTIINKADHSVVSTTRYDTFGNETDSNNLATALNGLTKEQLGVLTSNDAWEAKVTASLKSAFQRVGLYKALATSNSRRHPYAAIFEAASADAIGTAKAVEVLHSNDQTAPFAEIRGWLMDGASVTTGTVPNALATSTGAGLTVMVNESGNVGIGTTTPGEKLEVNGNIKFGDGNWQLDTGSWQDANIRYNGSAASANFGFYGQDDKTLNLIVQGRVGIGTTNNATPLSIRGNGGEYDVGITQNQMGGTATMELTTADASGNQATRLLLRGHTDNADIEFYRGARKSETIGMFIEGASGNVGIGTTTPKAKLHVEGSGDNINSFTGDSNGGAWMNYKSGAGSDEIGWANAAQPLSDVSIYASGSIVADGTGVFVASTVNWSDERSKRVIGRSNSKEDLDLLLQIKITDYFKIKERNREKKVIAQELRDIFPQAVSTMRGVVPTIFEYSENVSFDEAKKELTITLSKAHNLARGDLIDVYTDKTKLEGTRVIAAPAANTVMIECDGKPEKVFVYGKWVDDVHMVDYDAISMLNVSATQRLYHLVQNQQTKIEQQSRQYEQLKKSIAQLQEKVESTMNGVMA